MLTRPQGTRPRPDTARQGLGWQGKAARCKAEDLGVKATWRPNVWVMLNNAGDTCDAGDLVIDGSAGDLHLLP